MTKLKERFSRKEWKNCCGKGCKDCDIAQAYIGEYGKKEGLTRLNEERKAVKAGKKAKHGGKKNVGTGKKAKHGGKKAAAKA
jgi:hypothetical protein